MTKWLDEVEKFNANALRLFVCTKMDTLDNEFGKINFSQKPCLPFFIVNFSVKQVEQKVAAMGYQLASCSAKGYDGVQ